MNLRSDNESGAAPEIIEAIAKANHGSAHSYGEDAFTDELRQRFCEVFEKEVFVLPVATGTAANSLCIAQMTPSYGSVICYEHGHLYVDECGAPEFFSGGAKLIPLPGEAAKLSLATVNAYIKNTGYHGDHECKLSAISLSQATELGTVYSVEELKKITHLAHEQDMLVHIDGARFANALITQNCTPAEATWKSGVDFLSFGATKNGALAAEAVIVFDPAKADQLGRRRKRSGHLFSKMRFLSAQLNAYLADDLWLKLATHANYCARYLAQGLSALETVKVLYPVEANELFVHMPQVLAEGLYQKGHEFHPWPGEPNVYRMICAHNTTTDQLDGFLADAKEQNVSASGLLSMERHG